MHYVICYDLESDRKRAKAAQILQKHGSERVQKSVFVARRMDKRQLQHLLRDLRRVLQPMSGGDSLLVCPLSESGAEEMVVLGESPIRTILADPPVYKIL